MKTFEGMSSLRWQEGGRGFMLFKIIGFLLLLCVFSACRSARQHSELIHMVQRQQQQLLRYDTLWQVLELELDNLVVEWETDTLRKQVKSVRLTSSKAEVGLRHHTVTVAEVTNSCDDTLVWKREKTTLHSVAASEEKRRSRWWLWLLVGAVVGLGIGYQVKHHLSRR